MFGQDAHELLKEVHGVSAENLPPYNDEGMKKVTEAVAEHSRLMSKIFHDVQARQEDQGEHESDWRDLPEEACTVLVHHDSILRNKRLLLAYMYKRLGCIKEMWWRSRTLPEEFKAQLGPAEVEFYEKYDRIVNKYMGRRQGGINLTLTVDIDPPKDPSVQVLCVKDHGEVMFSIGRVNLSKDTAHLLPREEAEPFINSGVLVYLE